DDGLARTPPSARVLATRSIAVLAPGFAVDIALGVTRVGEHAPGGEHVHSARGYISGGHVLHDAGRAAALRVDEEVGLGMRRPRGLDVAGADARVHVALAVPHVHAPAELLLDVGAQPHVGPEEDLGVLAVGLEYVAHHRDRIGRRAAVIRQGLDLGGGVDVHDHHA